LLSIMNINGRFVGRLNCIKVVDIFDKDKLQIQSRKR